MNFIKSSNQKQSIPYRNHSKSRLSSKRRNTARAYVDVVSIVGVASVAGVSFWVESTAPSPSING